uniref:Uncharacterized protein n=1 Tax=Arcella intermedia TaxID=1963864 RepID=A0A6B2LEA3_9EUKA
MYIFGGTNGGEKYNNDLHVFNLNGMYCSAVKSLGELPSPRAYHRAAAVGRKVLIFGGQRTLYKHSKKGPIWYNDLHSFDVDTLTWEKIETQGTPPPPCGAGSFTVYNQNQVLFFGGGQWKKYVRFPELIEYYNDVYNLDTVTWTWRKVETKGTPPSPRGGHYAVVVGNSLLVTGGYITLGIKWPTFSDSFLLNLETFEWVKSHSIPQGVGNHQMVIDGNELYLLGGIDFDSNTLISSCKASFREVIVRASENH